MPNKVQKPYKPYWDACVFISLIQRDPGRIELLDELAQLGKTGQILVVTSSITLSEVIKWPDEGITAEEEARRIRDFFENPWITRRTADSKICQDAGLLRRKHSIKLPDAIHLATALHYKVKVLETYDETHLVKLNGLCGDPPLQIRLPSHPEPRPLFDKESADGPNA